jgi:hypothetical protein
VTATVDMDMSRSEKAILKQPSSLLIENLTRAYGYAFGRNSIAS